MLSVSTTLILCEVDPLVLSLCDVVSAGFTFFFRLVFAEAFVLPTSGLILLRHCRKLLLAFLPTPALRCRQHAHLAPFDVQTIIAFTEFLNATQFGVARPQAIEFLDKPGSR